MFDYYYNNKYAKIARNIKAMMKKEAPKWTEKKKVSL